jgi:hypothetical protein
MLKPIYIKMNMIGQKEMAKLKKDAVSIGHEIRKVAEYIGHEIKENTELAEHEAGIDNAKSTFSKVKKAL